MDFPSWFFERFRERANIIDLYFIVSDLKDIPLTPAERAQIATCDARAAAVAENHQDDQSGIPLGKRVY